MKKTKTPKKTSKTLETMNEKIIIVMTKANEYLVNESLARMSDQELREKLARMSDQELREKLVKQDQDTSPPVITTSQDKGYRITWLLLGLVVGYIFYAIFTK